MMGFFILICLLIGYVFSYPFRSIISLFLFFLLGLLVFQLMTLSINNWDISSALKIILNRFSLLFILSGIIISGLLSRQPLSFFGQLPDWQRRIQFPLHTVKISHFLLIGILGSCTLFIPLIWMGDMSYVKSVLPFAIGFSVLNAVLEELIWRGSMLSSLQRNVSTLYAVLTTSIGFGLLHISIGIPVMISLIFSFAGLFYAIVVLKTKSIYPAIAFHFVINLGMVFNGWIG